MSDRHPRFVVREISGYPAMGQSAWGTSYWIADSWYGYAVVQSWPTSLTGGGYDGGEGGRGGRNWTTPRRRDACERRCAEWNAEHDAWLAAG
jgi:hypothetical protein